jgi:hypothetical protein
MQYSFSRPLYLAGDGIMKFQRPLPASVDDPGWSFQELFEQMFE